MKSPQRIRSLETARICVFVCLSVLVCYWLDGPLLPHKQTLAR